MLDDLKNISIKRFLHVYKKVNRRSNGWIGIVRTAVMSFSAARAMEAAAGIAYYTFFSIFPLLILLVALGTFFLEGDQVQAQILGWVDRALPPAADLIESTLKQVINRRGTAGLAGVIGLFWAGSGAFNALARNVNRAWPKAKARNFLTGRLIALAMIGAIIFLLILSVLSTTIAHIASALSIDIYWLDSWSQEVSWFFTFIMFVSLYRWLPATQVAWSEAAWGAGIATIGWQFAVVGFSWYLGSGLAKYQLVYGTLNTVIVLLLWVYISAVITLFGAHLSAAVCRKRRSRSRNNNS